MDQWSANQDHRDPRDRDRRRGRGSNRDRGSHRHRERGRHFRPSDRRFDYPERSPPPRGSRFGPDLSHASGDSALDRSPPHRASGPPSSFHGNRQPEHSRPTSSADWNRKSSMPLDRDGPGYRRDESPFAPPSKRKRTRSPSPRGRGGSFSGRRPSFAKHREKREHSPSSRNRGRFPGRGAPRRRSPRRGRDRRGKERRHPDISRRRSRSPLRDGGSHPLPDRRSRSLSGDEFSDRNSRYLSRSPSRHSVRSANSRASPFPSNSRGNEAMSLGRSAQSPIDDTRSLSPPRPIPSFDSNRTGDPGDGQASVRDRMSMHGMRAPEVQHRQRHGPSRPHLDTNSYSTSPNFATPCSSQKGSPPPGSPFTGGRGGWTEQPRYSPG